MILTNEQTARRYTARRSVKQKRMRAWRVTELLGDMDAKLARVFPQWEQEVGSVRPMERTPAPVWNWNKALMAHGGITKTMLAVAFCIGTFATSETGENVWPSDDRIAEGVGCGRKYVLRYRQQLVKLGYLEEVSRRDGGTITYRLTVPVS